jgi:hypothetical protein
MARDLTQNLVQNIWVDTLRETRIYDSNGNMLSLLDEFCTEGQWLGQWLDTWTYDARGNMLTHLRQYWSDGVWLSDWRFL